MATSSPRESTIRKLFAVSGNQCAFPGCPTPIIDGPTGSILAEVCHIHAQNIGGPRYKEDQSEEGRHEYENLILMCRVHHKIIDDPNNLSKFDADQLRKIKNEHESKISKASLSSPELSDSVLQALKLSATTYDSGSVHMDFRQATFKVGGEGGGPGGGGGGGGLLTIVGLSYLPSEILVDLNGLDGKFPGGGGGGGGAIAFIGRNVETFDLENGFHISSIFTANSASIDNLLHVLGAAWSYCPIPKVPDSVSIKLVFIAECGNLDPGTLLRLDIEILDPNRSTKLLTFYDLEIPKSREEICRIPAIKSLDFEVDSYGIWEISVMGNKQPLARYKIEFRNGSKIPI